MTTFYNLIAGHNPYSRMALAIVGLDLQEVPRYNDSMIHKPANPHEAWTVGILARTGGPNRTHYDMSALENHPLLIFTKDMDADNTYATYVFRFPAELEGLGRWIVNTEVLEGDERVDAWVTLFNKLNKLKLAFPDSRYVLAMKKWIAPIMQQLMDDGKIDVQEVA